STPRASDPKAWKKGLPAARASAAEHRPWVMPGASPRSTVRAPPPMSGCDSRTVTASPARARVTAEARPLGPLPPTTAATPPPRPPVTPTAWCRRGVSLSPVFTNLGCSVIWVAWNSAVPSVSPAAPERAARRKGTQAVLEVRGKTRLSPRLLRVTLGGEQYSELRRNHHTDAYVKLLIASEESGLLPPYGLDAIRASAPEHLPARRTYTVRHWDDEAQTLDIDVVLHGDDGAAGVAARWADAAQPGDRIALSGAGG